MAVVLPLPRNPPTKMNRHAVHGTSLLRVGGRAMNQGFPCGRWPGTSESTCGRREKSIRRGQPSRLHRGGHGARCRPRGQCSSRRWWTVRPELSITGRGTGSRARADVPSDRPNGDVGEHDQRDGVSGGSGRRRERWPPTCEDAADYPCSSVPKAVGCRTKSARTGVRKLLYRNELSSNRGVRVTVWILLRLMAPAVPATLLSNGGDHD